jgi:hypothetical protein
MLPPYFRESRTAVGPRSVSEFPKPTIFRSDALDIEIIDLQRPEMLNAVTAMKTDRKASIISELVPGKTMNISTARLGLNSGTALFISRR